MPPTNPVPPAALLLVATGCSHCPAMLEHLSRLLKAGDLGRLEVINIVNHPEIAADLGVRGVPWCRIDGFAFAGLLEFAEVSEFVAELRAGRGRSAYLVHLLQNRRLAEAAASVREHPLLLAELVPLLGDLQQPMALRIGIGALVEELVEDPALVQAVPPLLELTLSDEPQVRADACHYLGLCADPVALPRVRELLDDDNPEVSEIAAETLALLHDDG